MKMEAIYYSETSVDFDGSTRRYIPEDSALHNNRCENIKSYSSYLFVMKRSTFADGGIHNMRYNGRIMQHFAAVTDVTVCLVTVYLSGEMDQNILYAQHTSCNRNNDFAE
jgi:allantoicase